MLCIGLLAIAAHVKLPISFLGSFQESGQLYRWVQIIQTCFSHFDRNRRSAWLVQTLLLHRKSASMVLDLAVTDVLN